ncbi:MAG TPA: MFS transporter [Telluria sp.]|nr:MFS transporter [Telluria sp.]
MNPRLTLLLAVAAGVIVANLYYAQTLVGPISQSTGISADAAGLIVTLTQVGYCLGLLFIVPLGDRIENRKMIVTGLVVTAAALVLAALATSAVAFLAAALLIGLGAVVAQVLVPFAAHLSPEASRGQTVGKVVSGLLIGIMLARPLASLIADVAGWHTVFGLAAVSLVALAVLLQFKLPTREPASTHRYPQLLASLWHLFRTTPVLRRRAAYHAALFGAFSLFWTTAPLILASDRFALSQTEIALFALVGMAGAVASPVAGKLADGGHSRSATGAALLLGVLAFVVALLAPVSRPVALACMVAASIVLDMAVAANLVLGQRAIYMLGAEVRSRLNGLYFALFFAGGAVGSSAGGWLQARHGMHGAMLGGLLLCALGLAYWLTELRPARAKDPLCVGDVSA